MLSKAHFDVGTPMALDLENFVIDEVILGPETRILGQTLQVDTDGLVDFLRSQDERLTTITITLALPGDSYRIICVKDVLEPRYKVAGDDTLGQGRVQALKGVAVVTCGQIVGFQEGIIDMAGPGAAYSPFSHTHNVVLDIAVAPGLEPHQHEEAVRLAGQRAAAFLAQAVGNQQADRVERYSPLDSDSVPAELPRVAYVYMLLSQGLLHDTYVFGQNAQAGLPRLMAPHELMDGAITSGNCVSACDKNTTYHHQNNPVLLELYRRHGHDLNLVGVVLTNEPVRLAAKQQSAAQAVDLVCRLGARGAVISKEGFGNPDADQIMLIRGLEAAGIKTVALTDEYAGQDGSSQSLADTTPEADAVVSVGNANATVVLPPMARTIGPIKELTSLAGAYPQSLRQDGSLEIELQGLVGATNQLGMQRLRAREV